jgi:hypothetical protein
MEQIQAAIAPPTTICVEDELTTVTGCDRVFRVATESVPRRSALADVRRPVWDAAAASCPGAHTGGAVTTAMLEL